MFDQESYQVQVELLCLLRSSYKDSKRKEIFQDKGYIVINEELKITGFSAIAVSDDKNNLYIFFPGTFYLVDLFSDLCLMFGIENPQMRWDVPKFLDSLNIPNHSPKSIIIYAHSLGVANQVKALHILFQNASNPNVKAFALEDVGSKFIAEMIGLNCIPDGCEWVSINSAFKNGFNSTLPPLVNPVYIRRHSEDPDTSDSRSLNTLRRVMDTHKLDIVKSDDVEVINKDHPEYNCINNGTNIYWRIFGAVIDDALEIMRIISDSVESREAPYFFGVRDGLYDSNGIPKYLGRMDELWEE